VRRRAPASEEAATLFGEVPPAPKRRGSTNAEKAARREYFPKGGLVWWVYVGLYAMQGTWDRFKSAFPGIRPGDEMILAGHKAREDYLAGRGLPKQ
jgi:hypothetical protein